MDNANGIFKGEKIWNRAELTENMQQVLKQV